MKFERIMVSGIVVDGRRPGDDPRLTLADIAHALQKERWGGHHPDRPSIIQHCLAMARRSAELGYPAEHTLACLHHDDAETFVEDLPTTLKAQAEMQWYKQVEGECHDSLIERFVPELVGYNWKLVKPLDRASLVVESNRFPDTPDRRAHLPFHASTLGLSWEQHYRETDDAAQWLWVSATLRKRVREAHRKDCDCRACEASDSKYLRTAVPLLREAFARGAHPLEPREGVPPCFWPRLNPPPSPLIKPNPPEFWEKEKAPDSEESGAKKKVSAIDWWWER